jgi:hypothetical protein
MNKAMLWIQEWYNCLSWIAQEIVSRYCPDLDMTNFPTHPEDYLWYAERFNGRAAMLAVIFILQWELVTHKSIWEFIGVY